MICPHYKGKDKCPTKGKIDDTPIAKHFASKGGKANKTGKRSDLKIGGATWLKIKVNKDKGRREDGFQWDDLQDKPPMKMILEIPKEDK